MEVGGEQAAAAPAIGGMPLNILVMKEPRGMIRAIQIVSCTLSTN